ncbi:MAG: hypothetical protein M3Q07_03120 [Pseudobdellovibrionaceae bacterium]|nr:hypothetical protein [Pseudobdellovibrionaceae bacterium]
MRIAEKENFGGVQEIVLPSDEDKNLWSASNDFSRLVKIDPVAQKSRLLNKIASVSCLCDEKAIDPMAAKPQDREADLAKIDAHKKSFETEFAQKAGAFRAAWNSYNNLMGEWTAAYSKNQKSFQDGSDYADVNKPVALKTLLDAHATLTPVYQSVCPVYKYQESFGTVMGAFETLKDFRIASRVYFAGWSNQLGYFGAIFAPETKDLLSLQLGANAYRLKLAKIDSTCGVWAKIIESIPQRVRYERVRAVLQEYITLSDSIVASLENSTKALQVYDSKLHWTWLVQEKIKETRAAVSAFHYAEAEKAVASLRDFWGSLYVEITDSQILGQEEKDSFVAEYLGRIQTVNTDWLDMSTTLGIKGIVLARIQNELNNTLLKGARVAIYKHEQKDVKFEEFNGHLVAAGFEVKPACKILADAVRNQACWTVSVSSSLTDRDYLDIDSRLNALTAFLKLLK